MAIIAEAKLRQSAIFVTRFSPIVVYFIQRNNKQMLLFDNMCQYNYIPYSAKRWQGKTLANRSFQSFGEENVGEFNLLTNS